MSASGEPITRCPVCRYDLTGLPKNHPCPECGFEYDESMRVWIIKDTASPSYLLPACVFGFMSVTFVMKFVPGDFARRFVRVSEVLSYGLMAFVLCLVFVSLRSHAFIVVSDYALIYRFALGSMRTVPWSEILFSYGEVRPRILDKGKAKRILLPVGFLRRTKRDRLFAAIREQWTNATGTRES